jgi:hypothetical protein
VCRALIQDVLLVPAAAVGSALYAGQMSVRRSQLLVVLAAAALACRPPADGKGPAGDRPPGDDDDDAHSAATTTPDPPLPPLAPWSREEVETPGSVAITELAYDAGPGDDLEWIELHNPAVVDLELTGWSLAGAVSYAFPPGVRVPARGYLVVASDPGRLATDAGIDGVLGPWTGRLDDGGERLELFSNGGRRIDSVRYGADDPWPVGADGTGFTLAKVRADGPGDRAEGWTVSREQGGTPGAPNGVDPLAPPTVVPLVAADATWAYDASGNPPDPDWAEPAYDDASWPVAEAPFYAGAPAPEPATIRVTADNDCAVYLGEADGTDLRLVGEDLPGDWTTTKSFATDVGPADHLFVTAWEDGSSDGGPQMVIAEVQLAAGIVGTAAAGLEWALGPPGAAPGVGAGPSPTELDVGAVVAAADLGGTWSTPAAEAPRSAAPWGATLSGSFAPATRYVWPDTFGDVSITNTQTTWVVFRSRAPLGAGSAQTDLVAAPTTARFRIGFDFAGDPAATELSLDCEVDDGAVFYLNGTEVLRHHLPAGVLADDTLATTAVTDDPALVATLPGDALVDGPNVLAVVVHQATRDPDEDLLFGCALEARSLAGGGRPPVLLHEVPAAGTAPFWAELAPVVAVDPAGFLLSSSAGDAWVVPAGALRPGDLLPVDLDPAPEAGDVVALSDADGRFLDAVRVGERGSARLGAQGPWLVPTTPTPGTENEVDVNGDVVITELAYHRAPISEEGVPFEERPDEWIELFNRGAAPVDLSGWQLVDAVEFVIPDGTVLDPGAFLVVANRARALRAEEPGITVLGDFEGALGNGTDRVVLRDAVGNAVDAVRYFDGGRWPSTADGGGATLERLDPWADSAAAETWAASDETARSGWADYEVAGVAQPSAVGPDGLWNELVLGLLDEGEVLIDDLHLVRDPLGAAIEQVQNGTFDDPTGWRLLGNHRHSAIVPDPDNPSNTVLRLVATGPTEHMHNHAETTLRFPIATAPYHLRFRARWVSGSNLLHSRLYFQRLPHVTRVARPATGWGTPGRPNSRGVVNLGPTFTDLRQGVVVPGPGEPVPIHVTATDPDGVAAVTLWSSVSGGPFEATVMAPDGAGSFAASLEGRPAGTVVQFYVEAQDGRGAGSWFPAEGPGSRALVRFDGAPLPAGLHGVRLILTDADSDWLHDPVNLMSNDRVGATVVLDDARVVYDAGVRAKGSERGRPETVRLGYALRFSREDPFRGSHRSVLLDRSQGVQFGQREFLLNLVAGRIGLVSAEYNDLAHAVTPRPEHTGAVELQIDRLSDLVLDNQFTDGADGSEYDYELVYYPYTTDDGTPTGLKLPQPDGVVGTPLTDLGPDPEAWRWTFPLQNNEDRDDYQPVMQLGRTFALPDGAFAATADTVLDVDQWLRAFAFATLAGAVDNYGGDGAQHNARFYQRPDDQRLLYFPHDLDFFGYSAQPVVGNADLARLITQPAWRRLYYQHLFDLVDRGFDPAALDASCAQVGALLPAQDFDGNCREMQSRADWVLTGAPDAVLQRYPVVTFAITTNGGADFETTAAEVVLEGDGWIDARDLWWSGSPDPLDVTWLGDVTWQVTLPLAPGLNVLDLTATDLAGNVVGADGIEVTATP